MAVLPSVVLPVRDRDTVPLVITHAVAFPLILKPLSEGGSIGMAVCHDSAELAAALRTINPAEGWFAEPFTTGTPVTCGILDVDGSPVALPPLETLPTDAEFYDYATKRDKAKHRYRCPAKLPSIADGLGHTSPSPPTWAVNSRLLDHVVTVTDQDITTAMAFAFRHLKVVAEPSGACALAAVLGGLVPHESGIGVVISGGGVDLLTFHRLISQTTRRKEPARV